MDVLQIKAARNQVARDIFEILKKLEAETGMFVEYVNIEGQMDFDGKNQGIEKVAVDLSL